MQLTVSSEVNVKNTMSSTTLDNAVMQLFLHRLTKMSNEKH